MKWIVLLLVFAPLLAAQPEMDLLRAGAPVADGGEVSLANTGTSPFNVTFTIENNGSGDLNLSGSPPVEITDADNCDVSLPAPPATPVPETASTTFTLQVSPIAASDFSFAVSIPNDDPDENPYSFTVSGAVGEPSSRGGSADSGDDCSTGEGAGLSMAALLGLLGVAWFGLRRAPILSGRRRDP